MPTVDDIVAAAAAGIGQHTGRAETLASLLTGAIAQPVSGLVGLMSLGRGSDAAADAVRSTQDWLTYAPRTAEGQRQAQGVGEAVGTVFGPLERFKAWLGDKTLEGTGAPGLATAAFTAPDALLSLLPFAKLKNLEGFKAAGSPGAQIGAVGPNVGRSRRVVGTTGQYVGAPAGVDSPQKMAQIVKNYLNAIEAGVPGREFYNESSAEIWARAGNDINSADKVAENFATTSRRQNVGGNTALAVRGNTQAMTGQPISSVGLSGNAASLAEIYSGQRKYLGHKREPFAEQLSVAWAPERIGRGVNDMHEAEIMGFPSDATLGATNHAFMDEIRDRAIKLANERKIGGFNDWNTGTAQAAAWTGNKIRRGEVTPGDAAKTYAYYLPWAEANATYETLPGIGTRHLPLSAESDFATKQAFHNDPRGAWTNAQGRDVLYTKTGLIPGPDVPSVGRFEGDVNPATVARPAGAKSPGVPGQEADVLAPYSQGALNSVEAFRAYMDAQNAGAWHKVMASKAPLYDVAGVDIPGLTPEMMRTLAPLFEGKGYGIASAPGGMSVMSFGGDAPIGAPFAKDVRGIVKGAGLPRPEFGKRASGYIDYADAWKKPQGSGTVTQQMLDQLNLTPDIAQGLEHPDVRAAVLGKNERDAAYPQWGNPRADVQTARKIFAAEGFDGLRRAIAAGTLVPAAAFALFGVGQLVDDAQQQQ